MITVTGGKWTTYRRMAEDTIDVAVATGRLPPAAPCTTAGLKLVGAHYYEPNLAAEVGSGAFYSSCSCIL